MKSTEQYLDEVKDRLALPSDYALAKALGVTRSAVSKYRTGRTVPDDLVCVRIAEGIGCEVMEVIAAVNYQRSTDDTARKVWEGVWGKAAGAIALSLIVCAGGLSVAPTSKAAESGNTGENTGIRASLKIMSSRRRSQTADRYYAARLAA